MAKIIQIGKDFYVEYKAQGLTFRKKGGANRADAEKLLAFIEANAGPEEFVHKASHDVDWKVFEEEFLKEAREGFSAQTLKRFEDALQKFDSYLRASHQGIIKIHHITPKVAQGFCEALSDNLAFYLLEYSFDRARARGYINDNPFLHLKRKPVSQGQMPTSFKTEEREALLAAASEPYRGIISFSIETGIRIEELVVLTWPQVNWAEPCLLVKSHLGRMPSEDIRQIPLTAQALEVLTQRKREAASLEGRIFPQLRIEDIKREIDATIQRATLDSSLTFNSLRHTFARNILAKGVGLVRLSQYLGIDDVLQAMIYEAYLPARI